MRILLDGRHMRDDYPGIGQAIFSLARGLLAELGSGRLTMLVDPSTISARFELADLSGGGADLLPCSIPVRSLSEQVSLPGLIRDQGADLYHCLYPVTTFRPPCATVITLHDLIPLRHPEDLPSIFKRFAFKTTIRLAVRTANLILTCSRASSQDLQAFCSVPAERIRVTPYAADPCFQPCSSEVEVDLLHRLDLEGPYVLSVGSNKPHKNLRGLIHAWQRVEQTPSLEAWSLVIAGPNDPRFSVAQTAVRSLGLTRVRFLGPVEQVDLVTLYSAADLFVMASFWEGFGLPVAEAMASATAVACSNTSSMPEVASGAARLFDPHDLDGLSALLCELLSDASARTALADAGLQRSQQLSWRATARSTIEAYNMALDPTRPRR